MDFKKAKDTFIVSDLHLSEAEPDHPKNPLWKRFKRSDLFIDGSFKKMLEKINQIGSDASELIINGDIFDFDSVMSYPKDKSFKLSWLEKIRGMKSTELKSCYKMKTILSNHPVWVKAVSDFIKSGNRVIFIIGNHDIELHWPEVQAEVIKSFNLDSENEKQVRFCEWFYISNADTLVEHGNQYDDYCLCQNPIHPLIYKNKSYKVRIPFANLAGKLMLNGMGLMNPNIESSFIKSSLKEYIIFFFKYVLKTQPFLLWTWFWSAIFTLVYSVYDGLLPAAVDPLTTIQRVDDIAYRSNSDPRIVRALATHHVHPAIFNPFKILRELWLDRALFLFFIFWIGYQVFTFFNLFTEASVWWFLIPVLILFPLFIFYASSVQSDVAKVEKVIYKNVIYSCMIANVSRVVLGHTHNELHKNIDQIEILNSGTWSSAFHDVECTKPYGIKCVVWLKEVENSDERVASLCEWIDGEIKPIKS